MLDLFRHAVGLMHPERTINIGMELDKQAKLLESRSNPESGFCNLWSGKIRFFHRPLSVPWEWLRYYYSFIYRGFNFGETVAARQMDIIFWQTLWDNRCWRRKKKKKTYSSWPGLQPLWICSKRQSAWWWRWMRWLSCFLYIEPTFRSPTDPWGRYWRTTSETLCTFFSVKIPAVWSVKMSWKTQAQTYPNRLIWTACLNRKRFVKPEGLGRLFLRRYKLSRRGREHGRWERRKKLWTTKI